MILRNATLDSFFSQLLLPHELAHQWWGNIVIPSDYRSYWIVEAMSNYSALQYLEQVDGGSVSDAILAGYRRDLTTPRANGELVDSNGPVTFDERLLNNFGVGPWHDILYEKGTWIFHMLRERMGAAAFHDFQLRVLRDFANRPLSNEDLREEAARFIPANQPDRKLTSFFDTWVYGTGIPTLSINGNNLHVTGVPESYIVDVPLQCGVKNITRWVRATEGDSEVPPSGCSLPPSGGFLFRD
jgi:aminopeptidase N